MKDYDEQRQRVAVVVPAHTPEPKRVLVGRRILFWAVAIGAVALLAVVLHDRPRYDSKAVPPTLIGQWTCQLPEYSDRFIELTPSRITFGTGGTSSVTYRIMGVENERLEGADVFVLHFIDAAGTKFKRTVVHSPYGASMHFASQPSVVWNRS
jgi:hypothetical protein